MKQPGFRERLFWSAFTIVVLLAATHALHFTDKGHRLELDTYEFLQNLLPSGADEELPITVVDIGKVPGGKDGPTSRPKLREMIDALAKHRPAVIGIDINFSPGATGWKVDDDPKFFDYCLAVKKETGIPIYVAVYETQDEPSTTWLGLDRYKELAAASLVDPTDTRRIPLWIKSDTSSEKLQTLSAALAKSMRGTSPGPLSFLKGTLESLNDHEYGIERGEDRMRFGMSLVNYRRHDQIRSETLSTISAQSINEAGEKFTGKMVLVGDATNAQDSFSVSGHGQIPGVYVLASAAYSLAADPLFEFNSRWRIIFDVLFAAILFAGIETVRRIYVKKIAGKRFHKARLAMTWGLAFLVFVLSIAAILFLHIVWFDFPAIIAALLLHTRVEHFISHRWKKSKDKRAPKGVPHENTDSLNNSAPAAEPK
ncbi:MAG TPA: CHASE2 domain-containing protein [Anaerolineales bacterium]|nr:CHASE2 domain-containing protein [Anaerolineales bacterium]